MVKACQIVGILEAEAEPDDTFDGTPTACDGDESDYSSPGAVVYRVQTHQSPYFDVFFHHHVVRVTIDSGATENMIRHATPRKLGSLIVSSPQSVHQADGSSKLHIISETQMTFTHDKEFKFKSLVVENLDVNILADIPFVETNDVAVRPAKREVILGDGMVFTYRSSPSSGCNASARRAFVLCAPWSKETIWPGNFIEMQPPKEAQPDSEYAIEPRTDSPSFQKLQHSQIWTQLSIVSSIARKIRIPNLTNKPRMLRRNEHFCQATPVFETSDNSIEVPQPSVALPPPLPGSHSSAMKIDPGNLLPPDIRVSFRSLLKEYDSVFDPKIMGYNSAAGPFKAKVNMGPIEPPQHKGCLPQYARGKLIELQDKFDQLEELGVFQHPEEIDITVEYLNPSFLVKKTNGGSRLVTAFADVGRYSKPQPSLLPDVDSTL